MKNQNSNYGDLFEEWEIKTAQYLIKRAIEKWKPFLDEQEEELLQEILIHWLEIRDRYSASRGAQQKTYLSRVVSNLLIQKLRENNCDKRIVNCKSEAIDDAFDKFTYEEYLGYSEQYCDTSYRKTYLQLDLAKVLSRLTARQQHICELYLFPGMHKTLLAEILNINRKTVYREMSRIREIFIQGGLDVYLKKYLD